SVVFYFPLHLLHHCAILSFYTSVHTAIYTLSLHDALPIMQLTKGRSLLGMPIQRTFHKQRLVRPLLFADKTMLYRYAEWHHIPFREDPSNRTHDYMRNRFRHTIIPKLLDENESLVYAVAKV